MAHTGGARADDSTCLSCHDAPLIQIYHSLPAEAEALKVRPVIDTVTVDAATLVPSVRFRIIDPTTPAGCTPAAVSGAGACAPYTLTHSYFTQTGGASRHGRHRPPRRRQHRQVQRLPPEPEPARQQPDR